MITELPQESINLFPYYVNKWTKIGHNTDPLNKEAATAAVKKMYECAGLKPPERFIFAQGPIQGALVANILEFKDSNPNATNKEITEHLKGKELRVPDCVYGQHEASWLSFYDFFRNETDIPDLDKIEGLSQVAATCGWVWAYDNVCIISSKPLVCNVNDTNQLHCTNGPAIAYADGTEIYAIDGVIMDKETIMHPEKITIEDIESSHNNEEQKRIMIEIYDVSRFLTDTKAEILDMDMVKINPFDENSDSIPRALIKDKNNNRYLVGTDGSTRRTYYINVPSTVNTCVEAHNEIAPLDESNCIASS